MKSESIVETLVAELKRIRLEKEISQRELARMTGLSRGGIRHMEDGDATPTLLTILRIGDALEVGIDEILRSVKGDSQSTNIKAEYSEEVEKLIEFAVADIESPNAKKLNKQLKDFLTKPEKDLPPRIGGLTAKRKKIDDIYFRQALRKITRAALLGLSSIKPSND